MAHQHPATLQADKLRLGPVAARLGIPGLLIGILALAAAAWLGLRSGAVEMRTYLMYAYLTAYCLFMMITLGSLGFVLIHYATRAAWSVVVRRLAEGLSRNFVLLIILAIPIVWQAPRVLHWLNPGVVAHDEILSMKAGYMNETFLYIRLAAYFLVWTGMAFYFSSQSAKQDQSGDPAITTRLQMIACPLLILFAYSLTGFAFDWIMGLDAHWYSTIFGAYIFAGAMLSMFATLTLLSLALKKRGLIGDAVNHEHYQDLGKWMFAFTFFWGYIGFAQYMLTWYSNLGEETQFFSARQIGHWASLSLVLLAVHFLIPFPGLLSRHMKRRNGLVAFWAVWSLLACALDLYWLIMPNQWANEVPKVVGHPNLLPQWAYPYLVQSNHSIYTVKPQYMDFLHNQIYLAFRPETVAISVLCLVGVFGLYLFSTMMNLKGMNLVPTKDPRLAESLAFENM